MIRQSEKSTHHDLASTLRPASTLKQETLYLTRAISRFLITARDQQDREGFTSSPHRLAAERLRTHTR